MPFGIFIHFYSSVKITQIAHLSVLYLVITEPHCLFNIQGEKCIITYINEMIG